MNAALSTVSFAVRTPASHPSLPGHFPGRPIVPGVVLLDLIVAALPASTCSALTSITNAKFLSPVLPEESIDVHASISDASDGQRRVHVVASRGAEAVLDVRFIFAASRA